eukprot:Rhum_TRINITY_DN205_c0_g1::Rhum_TRINITY_DN205_c0_g1_i1::g.847::m.847
MLGRCLLVMCAVRAAVSASSLADCQAVANTFWNTCDTSMGPVADILAHAGEDVTCQAVGDCTIGTSLAMNKCRWTRKLCVTCATDAGTGAVRIRVQTNGLPASCYKSARPLVEFEYDFEVDFNPPTALLHEPTTQDEVNDLLCDIQRHSQSNVPSSSRLVVTGAADLTVVSGVAVDGVAFLNPISADGVDPFYPVVYGTVMDPALVEQKVDECLGHPQGAGRYHYHTASPCLATRVTGSADRCDPCTDPELLAVNSFPTTLTTIGLAKDGHTIYGPYLADGTKADVAGLDVCNGAVGLDGDCGSYAYYATTKFPYLTGCFGQGNRPGFTAQCTGRPPAAYTAPSTSCTAAPTPSTTGLPNIFVFMPDDLTFPTRYPEVPHGYSGAQPPLPNLDRIRNEGAVFERAYTSGPKCAPSRYSLLTGRYPSKGRFARSRAQQVNAANAAWDGRVTVDVPETKIDLDTVDRTENVATRLKARGYATIFSGKYHLMPTATEAGYLTDYASLVSDIEKTGFETVASAYVSNMGAGGATDGTNTWSHNPEWLVETSLTAVEAAVTATPPRPFYLYLAPTGPHTPKTQAALAFDMKATPSGPLGADPVTTMRLRTTLWADAVATPGNTEKLAGAMWVDDALGAVLDKLEGWGVLDNTLCLFLTDHGTAAKATLKEGGTRLLQAVRYPAKFTAGTTISSAVVNTDIAATLFDLAGVTPEYEIDGVSWLDEGVGAALTTRPLVMEMFEARAVIAHGYKYVHTPGATPTEELYNLWTDGDESSDLSGSAPHDFIMVRMRRYLECHDKATSGLTIDACTPESIHNAHFHTGTPTLTQSQSQTQ